MKKAMTAIIIVISLITATFTASAQGKCETQTPCDGIRGNTETPYDILGIAEIQAPYGIRGNREIPYGIRGNRELFG
ncbi:MAG: hypothetical protein DRR08_10380 [Candidatus Parabeggiatoa sp. nov. 2]|nr:MAG: hypothetical protein B6247_26335 [Beggiatoa sp. 4572_84]RKZ60784.1 MAG: hypothetical protein DRR08_10380 [Gammaproteobacteria bacterium]HEC86025.1 hypothetical protein [Thioploca sp.]